MVLMRWATGRKYSSQNDHSAGRVKCGVVVQKGKLCSANREKETRELNNRRLC